VGQAGKSGLASCAHDVKLSFQTCSFQSKFLGDDDISIRFVCKTAQNNLRPEVSRVTLPVLTRASQLYGSVGKKLLLKMTPYVTTVSNAEWAMDASRMPLNNIALIAAIASDVLEVL